MKKNDKDYSKDYLYILLIIIILIFSCISINYISKNGIDYLKCNGASIFFHQIKTANDYRINGIAFVEFIAICSILYLLIIRNNEKQERDFKSVIIFVGIISILSAIILPNNSSDVYYYMASGRLDAKYNVNPYTVIFKDSQMQHMDDNIVQSSPALNTKFIYGSLWAIICEILSSNPTNSTILMLAIYKIANIFVHLLNCYLIYKITKKTKDVLIYGVNPLVIFEGLINCHNDIWVAMFIILAIYYKQKNKKAIAVAAIALGALIKYIPILMLPYIIFDKKIQKKDIKMAIVYIIELTIIFVGISYIKTGSFKNMLTFMQQTTAIANSIYLIKVLLNIPIKTLHKVGVTIFALICFIEILKENSPKTCKKIMIAFLTLVISNFRTWYIVWLFGLVPILQEDDKKDIIVLSIVAELANFIMYRLGEEYIYGIYYFLIIILTMICYMVYKKIKKDNIISENKKIEIR